MCAVFLEVKLMIYMCIIQLISLSRGKKINTNCNILLYRTTICRNAIFKMNRNTYQIGTTSTVTLSYQEMGVSSQSCWLPSYQPIYELDEHNIQVIMLLDLFTVPQYSSIFLCNIVKLSILLHPYWLTIRIKCKNTNSYGQAVTFREANVVTNVTSTFIGHFQWYNWVPNQKVLWAGHTVRERQRLQ